MFRRFIIKKVILCSQGSIFPRFYVLIWFYSPFTCSDVHPLRRPSYACLPPDTLLFTATDAPVHPRTPSSQTALCTPSDAPVIQFGAGQYSRLLLSPLLTSHTNDISVRFRTSKRDGLLLATSNTLNGDYLRMYIEGGQGKLETKMGGRVKVRVHRGRPGQAGDVAGGTRQGTCTSREARASWRRRWGDASRYVYIEGGQGKLET